MQVDDRRFGMTWSRCDASFAIDAARQRAADVDRARAPQAFRATAPLPG